jgi:NRAMP (natural resistance-associated macrophage protein)-like metal ion transporter
MILPAEPPTVPSPPTSNAATGSPRRLPAGIRVLGPGLITGAADDDPSGISTYSMAGAAFGYALLWTALFTLPLMAAVQLMCARIGMVTGQGLAGVLRRYYPRWLLLGACGLLLAANTVNIGADLGAMAAVVSMLTGVPALLLVPAFAVLILFLLVFQSYAVIARVFKWLTLVLFAYVAAAFFARPDWGDVLRGTLIPRMRADREYLVMLVAIFGTTISPYLFFWQAAEEVEEEIARGRVTVEQRQGASRRAMRAAAVDVVTGMSFSALIFYFVVLTTGATLHAAGRHDIQTAQDAAMALRPLAGDLAALLFSLGIIGTGLLGVSVLAGSAALAVAEAAGWPGGMNEKPMKAARFYGVMAAAMLAGMAMDFAGVEPMRMLVWAAVVNGFLAPPLIVVVLVVCNNRELMGEHRNGWPLNVLGGATALVMTGAAMALGIQLFR